jgi:uncharacterized protein
VLLPGLPTTPFLLLTAYFFAKSSPKLNNWLVSNRFFGPFIKDYRKHKSIKLSIKIAALSMMWTMITIAVIWLIPLFYVKIILLAVGIIGTIVVGWIIPTRKSSTS